MVKKSMFVQIDEDIINRMEAYVVESKLTKKTDTDKKNKLVETAIDQYLVTHPILTE